MYTPTKHIHQQLLRSRASQYKLKRQLGIYCVQTQGIGPFLENSILSPLKYQQFYHILPKIINKLA